MACRSLPRQCMSSAARSPIAIAVRFVVARGIVGAIERSATRRPAMPWTCNVWSTTVPTSESGPMRAVPAGWYQGADTPCTYAARLASVSHARVVDQRKPAHTIAHRFGARDLAQEPQRGDEASFVLGIAAKVEVDERRRVRCRRRERHVPRACGSRTPQVNVKMTSAPTAPNQFNG